MKKASLFVGAAVLCSTYSNTASAAQPVMSEVPRWDNGYGYQVFQSRRSSDTLMQGDRELANPNGLSYGKNTTNIDGVYTWRKWIRVTLKIPIVDQTRSVLDDQGNVVTQTSKGLDDVTLALPLKYYMNRPGNSGHIGFTPQVRFGGDDSGPYQISDGSTDFGASLGWEYESSSLVLGIGSTYWFESAAGKQNDWSLHGVIGWNFHDRGSLRWETDYKKDPNKYLSVITGPTLAWNFNDVVLARIEYRKEVDAETYFPASDGLGLTRGDVFRIGVGMVF